MQGEQGRNTAGERGSHRQRARPRPRAADAVVVRETQTIRQLVRRHVPRRWRYFRRQRRRRCLDLVVPHRDHRRVSNVAGHRQDAKGNHYEKADEQRGVVLAWTEADDQGSRQRAEEARRSINLEITIHDPHWLLDQCRGLPRCARPARRRPASASRAARACTSPPGEAEQEALRRRRDARGRGRAGGSVVMRSVRRREHDVLGAWTCSLSWSRQRQQKQQRRRRQRQAAAAAAAAAAARRQQVLDP